MTAITESGREQFGRCSRGGLLRVWALLGVMCIYCPTTASASNGHPYRLDAAAGSLTVTGGGRPPAEIEYPAQARLMAERAAVLDAYGRAARLLSEALQPQAAPLEGSAVFLRGGKVTRTTIAPDGSVSVDLEIFLSPELTERVGEALRSRPRVTESERAPAGISHAEFVARRRVPAPRVITLGEWLDRYRSGAWARPWREAPTARQ